MAKEKPDQEDYKGPISWMTRNRVTANLLMALFIVGGLLTMRGMKQEVFPEYEVDAVLVTTSYPGSTPEEVERGITIPIEEAARSVEGVTELWSRSSEGSSRINIEFDASEDRQRVFSDIEQQVKQINTFPEQAEEPEVALRSRRRDVMDIQIYGDISDWALRNLADRTRLQLIQTEGVTQVELSGARDYEVHIMPNRETLRRYGLTLEDIAQVVESTSIEVGGGSLKTPGGEILVRFDERKDYAQEFANIPLITTESGGRIRLGDVAQVREGFEDSDEFATFNGKPAIGIEIFRVGDETPIGVSDAVRGALEEIKATMPQGVEFAINDDDSVIYRQRRDLLLKNMGIGLTLVLLFLGLFLEPRVAFWVTLGIPISFLGAFLFFPYFGVSINMISMFAFIVALGIVVDDAIVVGENVHEFRSQGMPPMKAAIHGARDVAMPVTFSILSNCVAFLPLAFIPGTLGKIWFVIPVVVCLVFLVSLVESLFILPAHLSHLSPKPTNPLLKLLRNFQQHFADGLTWLIQNLFAPVLRVSMKLRYITVAISLGILAVSVAYAMSGRMGMGLMPKVESDEASVDITIPVGSPLSEAERIRSLVEEAAKKVVAENGGEELSTGIYTEIEGSSIDSRLYLTPPEVRPLSTARVADLWRQELGEVTGIDFIRFSSDRGGPGGGASFTVDLNHPDIPTLERAGRHLAAILDEYPQVADIDDGSAQGKPQMEFSLNEQGRSLGLTSRDVAGQIRDSFEGARAIRQLRGRNEVDVLVKLPEEQRSSEYDIEQLMITTPSGGEVPLRLIADIQRTRAYTAIERNDARRTVEVTANVVPESETNLVKNAMIEDVLPQMTRDFPGLVWSFGGRQADMADSMRALGISFIFAMLVIYAMLAIPFKSYAQPLIVIIAIPFGTVGAVIGHYIMGYSLSVISMMGIIALSGVVINDALVMVVYANKLREKGTDGATAIYQAGIRRFRPILLTTLTTFGGLAPMIFETSRQARFMVPMAISLGYGLIFATAITLVLVPALYVIFEDFNRFFARMKDWAFHPIHPEEEQLPEGQMARSAESAS